MPALPGYYTTKEAAEKLGYKDASSLSRLCSSGAIPGVTKVGKAWLIPENWVLHMLHMPVHPKGNRGVERKERS